MAFSLARQCRLAGQVLIVDRATTDQLENRIAPQHIVVVLIRVIREDAVDSHPSHLKKGMIEIALMTTIGQSLGKLLRQPDLLIELAKR